MTPAAAGAVVPVERFFELSLAGLLASGLLALASSGELDALSLGLGAAGLLLRTFLVTGLLRRWPAWRRLAILAGAGVALCALDYALLSKAWLPASLHLAFWLAALGMLAARPGRDDGWLVLGALLALLAASWWSTNLYFVGALAAFLLFGVAAFASAELRRSARKPGHVVRGPARQLPWRLAALSAFLAAGILLLTGGMFFVLPRTAEVAFRRLAPERFRVPGFSKEVTLGPLSRVQYRQEPLLRVRFHGERPAESLKWRGNALVRFDGRRWFNPADAGERLPVREGLVKLAENHQLWRRGRRVIYGVRLGAAVSDTLFLAGTPEFVRIQAPEVTRSASAGYRLASGSAEGLHYVGYSFLEPAGAPEPGAAGAVAAPSCCLDLPPVDPRIVELARQVTAGLGSEEARARALEQYLQQHYGYSTKSVSDRVADPLAHFLFRRREGHCEYFASALAVMLRLVGIPSRLATGFRSGVYNPVSGWQVFRASDAHTWVEAWIPGYGWSSFDPTPPQTAAAAPSAWTRLGWYVDAAETFWDEWVLRYDLSRQLALASRMETSGRDLSTHWLDRLRHRTGRLQTTLAAWGRRYGAAGLAGLALAAAAYAGLPRLRAHWRTRRRLRRAAGGAAAATDATLLYAHLLSLLKRRGFVKPAWQTPTEFARQLPASPTASLVEEFTRAYNELRFGGRSEAAVRLATLLSRMQATPGDRAAA